MKNLGNIRQHNYGLWHWSWGKQWIDMRTASDSLLWHRSWPIVNFKRRKNKLMNIASMCQSVWNLMHSDVVLGLFEKTHNEKHKKG